MVTTPVDVPFFSGLREVSLQLELKESFWNKGPSRCCKTFSVELNMAEPLIMSAEYGTLEMVKLIVKVSRLCHIAVLDSGCGDDVEEGKMVVAGSGVVGGTSGPGSL